MLAGARSATRCHEGDDDQWNGDQGKDDPREHAGSVPCDALMRLPGVVLVEGASDRRAVETLARRRGGDVRLAGLYDVGEERHFLRALGCDDRGELERAGFYACTRDLEDELTRAVGPDGMERLLAEQGELRAFRTYQKQPAHRARPLEEQLHGFMWNRKQKYAVLLVETLDLEHVPRPLDRVLEHF